LDTHARDSEHLLYFLQYRSALLVAGNGEDNFQFAHKSFHEYLAASHLLDQPNWKDKVQVLLSNNLEWWREVFLLLVKKYSDGQYGDSVLFLHHLLLREYPQDGTLPETHLQQVLLLAATAGLELAVHVRKDEKDADVLYKNFHRYLQTKLVELLRSPQLSIAERAEAGRLLSELGDPRPGVGCKTRNGERMTRKRGEREYNLPDFDWQEIPAATFHMGTDGSEGYQDEKPAHDVFVPRFFMSRYPVTNAQFRCFIQAGLYEDEEFWHDQLPKAARLWLKGSATDEQLLATIPESSRESYKRWLQADQTRTQPRSWANQQWNADNHPVVGVSWFEALAYSVWLNEILEELRPNGQTEGFCLRLPTEAEWEYAARGMAGYEYAWGNDPPDASKANYDETGLKRTCAVGLYSPDVAYGLHEMIGNVWEWTLSRWGKDSNSPDFTYEQWREQENERNLVEPVEFRVIRGGSWDLRAGILRCAFRYGNPPSARSDSLGFRLVLGSPW
jgi:formylglycine-generating enzyme required for sulfatase activity